MINMTRGEEMTLEVKLDMEPEEMESLTLTVVQGGRPFVRKEMADAEPDTDEGCVYFSLMGAETALLRAGIPAFAGRYVSQAEKAAVRAEQSAAVAEAWAVGEKGGAPVGSTDETFHNNARHFAEQAAASVAFAQTARTTRHNQRRTTPRQPPKVSPAAPRRSRATSRILMT